VSELTDASDPRAVNASLCRVLDHRCFQMVRSLHDAPAELVADSAMSFREFWDRGGRQWLLYALSLGDPDHDYLAATPTILPTYALETRAGHPLAPLLCSLADDDCGRDTAGWLLRAQLAMDTPRQREDRSGKQAECKDAALAQPEPARLSVWYQCISRIGLREAFPIGRFRAPDRGWLIIRGRRGHYQFCDEIRLYDVATGSVYVAQNCSGLFDFNRANMQTVPRSFVGCTSVDNLREWVLILALAGKAIDPMRPGEAFRIPAEIERSYTRSFEFTGRGRVFIHSSDQTHLPFAYYRDGQIVASGELVWPEHHNSALWHHAVELARVAEAGIVKGCALARFPTDLPIHTSPRGVSRVDAEPSHLSDINRGLRDELFALRERALCPATERGESARAPRARDARRRLVRVPSRER
jgi:hypothetical protein